MQNYIISNWPPQIGLANALSITIIPWIIGEHTSVNSSLCTENFPASYGADYIECTRTSRLKRNIIVLQFPVNDMVMKLYAEFIYLGVFNGI
jgi:hypothetical protein